MPQSGAEGFAIQNYSQAHQLVIIHNSKLFACLSTRHNWLRADSSLFVLPSSLPLHSSLFVLHSSLFPLPSKLFPLNSKFICIIMLQN